MVLAWSWKVRDGMPRVLKSIQPTLEMGYCFYAQLLVRQKLYVRQKVGAQTSLLLFFLKSQ